MPTLCILFYNGSLVTWTVVSLTIAIYIYIWGHGPPGWGSLESETVKCGHESRGTRSWECLRWRGPAAVVNDRPILSSKRFSRKRMLGMSFKGLVGKTNWLAINRQSLGNSNSRAECSVLRRQLEEQEVVSSRSPFSEDVSTEAEDIVGIRHHATTGEDIADWEDFICLVFTVIFGVHNSVSLS
jgi:hypothetical protein